MPKGRQSRMPERCVVPHCISSGTTAPNGRASTLTANQLATQP